MYLFPKENTWLLDFPWRTIWPACVFPGEDWHLLLPCYVFKCNKVVIDLGNCGSASCVLAFVVLFSTVTLIKSPIEQTRSYGNILAIFISILNSRHGSGSLIQIWNNSNYFNSNNKFLIRIFEHVFQGVH